MITGGPTLAMHALDAQAWLLRAFPHDPHYIQPPTLQPPFNMGDEVTKKDLQSLQGYCNKQIADLEKRLNAKIDSVVESTNKAFKQETDGINKTIETYNKGFADLTKRVDDIAARVNQLVAVVNQHAKAINE